jgi:hypothetical protein
MAVSKKDGNGSNSLIAALNTDGRTITPIQAYSTTHALLVNDATTGSNNGPTNALHDDNGVPTICAVSSTDGKTVIVLYADSGGSLLIQSS